MMNAALKGNWRRGLCVCGSLLLGALVALAGEVAGDPPADAGELLPYEIVHSLRGVWAHLGVSNVVVGTPTETLMGAVQVRIKVNLTSDAPLRGMFRVSDPASYVDVVSCLPSNALTAVAFSNDLRGVVAAFEHLREDLPEAFALVDSIADGLRGVSGGTAAATVPDPGSPLGVGRLCFCGIEGVGAWNDLTNALDRVMDIEPIAPQSTERASIRLKPGHFYSKLFGGSDPVLSLVERDGRYFLRAFSSAVVRERYDASRTEDGTLFDDSEFRRCSEGLRDRAGCGFAYVSKGFIPTLFEATLEMPDLLKGFLMYDEVWNFSVFEMESDGLSIVAQMPRGEENMLESAARCAINATKRWLPMLPELVRFEDEVGHLEDTTVGFVRRVVTLANYFRQLFSVAGIDYSFCAETDKGECDEEFVLSRFSLRVGSSETEDAPSLMSLIAAGKAGENPAEDYLPNSVVSAVACQPNVETYLGLLSLLHMAIGGQEKAIDLLATAFPPETDGHSFALAQTAAAEDGEPDVLIVMRSGSEATFRELKDVLDDAWILEEKSDLLVLRRDSGSEEVRNLRLAFHREASMFFLSTSTALLDQSLAAGANSDARLCSTADYRRLMGEIKPHNVLRYRAGNIFGRSAKRLSNVFSCVLPDWLVAQVLGSGALDLGECGFGVKIGDAFVYHGRAPKVRHKAFRDLALAVARSLGEVLQKSCPYDGKTARVFESAFTRQDVAAADASGKTTVRLRNNIRYKVEDLTMAVDVGKVSESDGCTYIPSDFALVGIWDGADAGLMSVAFERPDAMPELSALISREGDGVWVVTLGADGSSSSAICLPREAELVIRAGGMTLPQTAFMGWGVGCREQTFSLALNPDGIVDGVPVRPSIGDLDAGKPFAVGDGRVSVTVRAIPGLKYELRRGTTLRGEGGVLPYQRVGAPVTAEASRVTLTDENPPEGRAFYVITVTR